MKKFQKTFPYSLKAIVPMTMLAGATMLGNGCKPIEPELPRTNKELVFTDEDFDQISNDTIQKYLNMSHIDTVFMVPYGSFYFDGRDGPAMVRKSLEPSINMSPRVRGRGNVEFLPGQAAANQTDSLWFVNNGWTVTKLYWEQQKNR